MQTLIDFGVSFVVALQSLGQWQIPLMKFFSNLGTEDFFFVVLPLLYWCVDSALGIRVGFILVAGNFVNLVGKVALAGPRPYWVSSQVQPWWPETSFGAPSGHAQHAMSVWGMIAVYYKKQKWLAVVCAILIFMVGVSRLSLGSHFPHDVLLGWLIGALLLWLFVRYWDSVAAWLSTKSFSRQVGIAFAIAVLAAILGLALVGLRSGFQIPELWTTNALRSGLEPNPIGRSGVLTSAGTFFGLAAGLAWIQRRGGYQVRGPFTKRALCYIVGLIGVLVFWQGLGFVFPRGDGLLEYSLRFLRYALVGGWVTAGAPWLFAKLKLNVSS